MRISKPSLSAALTFLVIVAALLAAALALDRPVFQLSLSKWFGVEVYKLLLQFLLVTVMGGGIFAWVTARRDEQLKAEAKITQLQALDGELGDAYRAVKRVKRNMRAKLRRKDDGSAEIDTTAFEIGMDELLDAQIATEEVREHLAIRSDLIDRATRDRMAAALRYAARYLHDVYEDHERGRLRRARGRVFLDPSAPALADFLLKDGSPDTLKAVRNSLRGEGPLGPRFAMISEIETSLQTTDQPRRYAAIMTESFQLCVRALRAELATAMRRNPHLPAS
jgi:hypothetical protein